MSKGTSGKRRFGIWAAVVACVLLSSCAGPQLEIEPVAVSDNPAEAVAQLENKVATAVQGQVNALSPDWFNKASRSLGTAKELLARGGELSQISEVLARGHAELRKAEESAARAKTSIPEAIEARRLARAAGATSFADEYASVEDDFLNLTREIEDDNIGYAHQNQKKVAEAYHQLEVRAIKEHTLGAVAKLLEEAEAEDADDIAPALLADARKELGSVDAFISSNPYATEEMQQKAEVARFKAARLLQLVRQSRRVDRMEPLEISLWVEGILKESSERLRAADMRDQTFQTQTEHLMASITSVVNDRDFLQSQGQSQQELIETMRLNHPAEVERLKEEQKTEMSAVRARYEEEIGGLMKKVASLEGKSREEAQKMEELMAEKRAEEIRLEAEKRMERERMEEERRVVEGRLASERRFNQLYNEVSGLFTPKEAECYKQGLQMVIRLRSMQFPVGESIILPDNYALLTKVQQSIRTFGEPGVVIEGHTDSTGSPEFNELLSQQRADAVRQYLLANQTVKEGQIVAAGYGASRPLAPNTTVEGRAINRRIDVVITPGSIPAP